MKKYRIVKENGLYYIQRKFWFWWLYIKYKNYDPHTFHRTMKPIALVCEGDAEVWIKQIPRFKKEEEDRKFKVIKEITLSTMLASLCLSGLSSPSIPPLTEQQKPEFRQNTKNGTLIAGRIQGVENPDCATLQEQPVPTVWLGVFGIFQGTAPRGGKNGKISVCA